MTIDLNQLIKDHGYEAEITPPESTADGELRRKKDQWIFAAALGLVVCVTLVMLGWLILGTPSADDKKWLFGLLGSIVGWSATVLTKK